MQEYRDVGKNSSQVATNVSANLAIYKGGIILYQGKKQLANKHCQGNWLVVYQILNSHLSALTKTWIRELNV